MIFPKISGRCQELAQIQNLLETLGEVYTSSSHIVMQDLKLCIKAATSKNRYNRISEQSLATTKFTCLTCVVYLSLTSHQQLRSYGDRARSLSLILKTAEADDQNLGPLVYKASSLSTTQWWLLSVPQVLLCCITFSYGIVIIPRVYNSEN